MPSKLAIGSEIWACAFRLLDTGVLGGGRESRGVQVLVVAGDDRGRRWDREYREVTDGRRLAVVDAVPDVGTERGRARRHDSGPAPGRTAPRTGDPRTRVGHQARLVTGRAAAHARDANEHRDESRDDEQSPRETSSRDGRP